MLRYVRRHYPRPRIRAYRRVETPPGAQAQVDWGEFSGVDIGDGPQKLYAFIMVLSHSRRPVVIWSLRTDQLAWHHVHNEAFRRLQGVPAVVRIDNLKTGVARGAGPWGEINKAYQSYARSLRFHVDPCLPRAAWHKGKVEKRVSVLRRLDPRRQRFDSLEELQAWTDHQIDRLCERLICPATGLSVVESYHTELACLQPVYRAHSRDLRSIRMQLLKALVALLRALLASRSALALENLALRHQLAVLHRTTKRPKLRRRDRVFWTWLARLWPAWKSAPIIVQPETVIRWHRLGFRLYWRWKSRTRGGRPKIALEARELIRQMSREKLTWGAPRICAELALLGHEVAESTVAKYLVRTGKPPSQSWRTFLTNHVGDIAAIDFFVVRTVTFRLLYCFVVLRHDRRRVVHFDVTDRPTAAWTAQQLAEAFASDAAPRYLLRDNDPIYGDDFVRRVKSLGVEEVVTSPHSPWQNPYAERMIGTLRRECLDHVIVLGEGHLRRLLRGYLAYYHADRPHMSLERNSPDHREVESPEIGRVLSLPRVGGLHHRYVRAA